MNRRDFILGLVGAAAAGELVARLEPAPVPEDPPYGRPFADLLVDRDRDAFVTTIDYSGPFEVWSTPELELELRRQMREATDRLAVEVRRQYGA